ncbi:MAG: DUF115 domain-containing protein [Clostridiales bacterium]|nr:DUF115 domain-containing protein [Clostridiales bacterium]
MEVKSKIINLSDSNIIFKRIKLFYWRAKNIPAQIKIEKSSKSRKSGKFDSKFEKLFRLKNTHINQRCFIIATGPSLTIEDLELLKDETTFGMNSITKIFEKTSWRPTYYGIQDRQVYEKMEASILENYKNSSNVFVADELENYFSIPSNFIEFPYNGNYHLYNGKYEDYSAKFSDNAYGIVYDGYSITYSLIQIAVYMGFKEIYLLGCDCNYPKGEKNHFVESGFVDKNASSNPIRMRVGYQKVKEYADANAIKIVNCTRGGMLEVFPRAKLEHVIGKEK